MIRLRNVSKKYREKVVVDSVDLELPKNKIIAFIGSNGAGKSTLLSMIARTLMRNSGDIFIDEKHLNDWKSSELAKKLAILKQSNHFNIRLTIRELVAFGRYPYSKGRLNQEDNEAIDEALAYMGLTDLQDRYLDELSGGQRQLACIAMVIAQNTEYIFLDEPLNNLDMHHSVQIMKVLQRLVIEKGKTVMVVIHDINFVSYYAEHIIAMKHGKLVRSGSNEEMIRPEVLNDIYGMDINVQEIGGKNVCLYYE